MLLRRPVTLLLLSLIVLSPRASSQISDPFEGVPWVGYNVGSSVFPGNPGAFERDPYAIASGDFDGDGDTDVVVANYDYNAPGGNTNGSSGFAILFNQGDGTYGAPVHYTFTVKGSFDIVVADFDEDGYPDLALPNSGRITSESGSTVAVFLNDGSGGFTASGEFQVAERPLSIAAGDFDGDGHVDLVADSYRFDSRNLAVLFGTGTGGFAPRVLVPVVNVPNPVAAADLDGDGDDDIMASVLGDLYVAISNGDRTFAAPVLVSETGSQPIVGHIAAGDLNGDGDLDLVHGVYQGSGTYADKDVAVRLGNGDGTFGTPAYYDAIDFSTTPEAVVLVDLDGDGDLDVATCDWSGTTGDGIALLFNDGTGGLGGAHHVPAGQGTQDIAVADIDGDGDPDVLSADRMSLAVTVHRNPGDGRLPILATRYAAPSGNLRLDAGDVDGDGDLDVFASSEATGAPGGLLKNNGDGTFATPVLYSHSFDFNRGAARAKLRDLDGDGDLDLLYNDPHTDSQDGYNFYSALNEGTGTFGPITTWFITTCGMGDVDAFDLDNDGDFDAVNLEELNCFGQNFGNRIFVSLNDGDGSFQHLAPFQVSAAPRALAGGDLNRDGNVDLVTTHWGPTGIRNVINVMLGNGDGTFQDEQVYAVGQGPMDVIVVDLDGDGHLDIATANSGSDNLPTNQETMSVLWGTGNGAFSSATTYYAPFSPDLLGATGITSGDVDGDDDLDLMVTTVANGVAMYYNDDARGFDFAYRLGIYWRPFDPFFVDFTGDGTPDLATLVSTPPSGITKELAILPGLTGGASAPVTVSAAPTTPPVVIPASGGAFAFTVTLTNVTDQPQSFEAWSAATGPVSRSPLIGPRAVTLPPGVTVTRTLVQQVPGAALAGTYTYTVNVGTFPGTINDSDSFPVEKESGAARGPEVMAWSVSGWDAEAAASRAHPERPALSAAYPNPFSRIAHLTLEVPEAQRVTVAVYDALGRQVAVLHDGMMEGGAPHRLTLEAAELPSGIYVVRATGETFSATRRAALLR